MATYKVLQDIEAEDKLLGPLTLKQFIYAVVTVLLGVIAFMLGRINILLAVPWLVPMAFFGFMASPIGRDQPNDVWLAARIRFMIKPRLRTWNQAGLIDLVTITAPKREVREYTDNLNQTEVKSRLRALASTLDSRGWAVKNVNVNLAATLQPVAVEDDSDRLISIESIPQEVATVNVTAADDILDPVSNMVAQRFDTKLKEDQQKHINVLRDAAADGKIQPEDYAFIQSPPVMDPGYTTFSSQVVAPHSDDATGGGFLSSSKPLTPDEQAALDKFHKDKEWDKKNLHPRERVVTPLSEQKRIPDDKIKELANVSDISVAGVASLAHHAEEVANKEEFLDEDKEVSFH